MGLLFEGGDYSRAASDQGNTVHLPLLRVDGNINFGAKFLTC